MIRLQEHIRVTGFFRLYTMKKLMHSFFLSDEAWFSFCGGVLTTAGIGMKKIQDIFTNSLFITKILVFGVR
jgi:hypothetical protein